MATLRVGILALFLTVYAACGADPGNSLPAKALEILEKPDSVEVYSIDPGAPAGEKPEKLLRGNLIRGSVALKDAKVRDGVIAALKAGAGRGKGARCFVPHHALRAKHGDKTVDLVICFKCDWIYVYYDDDKKESAVVTTNRDPLPEFEKILK
jgi:hypothetical protein